MTNKNNNRPDAEKSDFFDQFSDEERAEIKKLWQKSSTSSPQEHIEKQEIEEAWSNVNARTVKNHSNAASDHQTNWVWMAAAAVVLLVAGAGFLLVPKTVTAPNGKIVATTLPDGSIIELNSGTTIQYNRLFGYTNRTIDLNGEAYFSVIKSNQPFIVEADQSTIQVTGTEFNVRSWDNDPLAETEVTVTEGQVNFYQNDSKHQYITINPGHISTLSQNMTTPSAPQKVQIKRIIGWRSKQLMFNNKSLVIIFNELERRFDVKIKLQNSRMGQQTLTAYYANPEDIESVLKDICRVKGLQYAKTANGYRVYKSEETY